MTSTSLVVTPPPFILIPTTMTEAIYWAAQTHKIQAIGLLIKQGVSEEILVQAISDAFKSGETLDQQIHAWRWPPLQTMQFRLLYGYKFVPALGSNVEPNTPGPTSIRVSLNPVDYLPFDSVVIDIPPAITCPVGTFQWGTYFAPVKGYRPRVGDKWSGTTAEGYTGSWEIISTSEFGVMGILLWDKKS